MSVENTATPEVTTFSDVNEGDVIRVVDGDSVSTGTVVSIDHSGGSLLPISVRMGLVTYGFDNERDKEVTVLARAAEKEDEKEDA